MALTEILVRAGAALDGQGLRYMLIGGMAVSTWVEPRVTRDVDLVVLARRKDWIRLKRALLEAGARVTGLEMRLLFEKSWVRLEIGRVGGTRLDIHVAYAPHDRAALDHARPVRVADRDVPVAAPEDLLLYKLQAWRDHDRLDARALLRGVKDVDVRYVESWLDGIARISGAPMRERWAELRALPPP